MNRQNQVRKNNNKQQQQQQQNSKKQQNQQQQQTTSSYRGRSRSRGRRTNSRNFRSKGRSGSQGRYRSVSRRRDQQLYRFSIPIHSGANHNSVSAQKFTIEIHGDFRQYSPVAYLFLALFHLLWNKNDSKNKSKSILDNISEAFCQIIDKLPKGVSEPGKKTYVRLVFCFEAISVWCLRHFNGWPRASDQRKDEEWYKHITTKLDEGETSTSTGVVPVSESDNEHVSNIAYRLNSKQVPYQYKYSKRAFGEGIVPHDLQKHGDSYHKNVYLSTINYAYKLGYMSNVEVLIIDEASRLQLCEVFLFLTAKPNIKRVILFGDKYQSVVYNPLNLQSGWCKPVTEIIPQVCVQYKFKCFRCGPKTVRILNELAYKEKPLWSMVTPSHAAKEKISFINTCNGMHSEVIMERENSNSFLNKNIFEQVKSFIDGDDLKWMVITPYNPQRELYSSHHIRALTIDSAQGKEYDNVILDLTRCNESCEIGFIKNVNRAVVALSRHKYNLRIYGCRTALDESFLSVLINDGFLT